MVSPGRGGTRILSAFRLSHHRITRSPDFLRVSVPPWSVLRFLIRVHARKSAGSLATMEEWENVPSVAGFPKGVAQTVVAVATVCCSPPRERWECVGFKMRSPRTASPTRAVSRGGVREGRHMAHTFTKNHLHAASNRPET